MKILYHTSLPAMRGYLPYKIIFSHEFAKAFWGEEETQFYGGNASYEGSVYATDPENSEVEFNYPLWMWHLQQMVISENPIKYLEAYL